MTIRIVLEGRNKDVEECLSVGDTVWISDEKVDALLGGPLTVISCDEVTEGQSDAGRVALGDRWLHYGSKRRTLGQASGSRSLPKSEL